MKDVYVCRKCGFVSTIRRAFVSVRFFDEFGEYTYGHECGACYAEEPDEAPANIQQQVILTRTKPEENGMERSNAFKARLEYERNCEAKYDRLGRSSLTPREGERMDDYAGKYGCTRKEMIDVLPEVERYMQSGI